MEKQSFHSKILLFGEYSIIQQSMGLSVPYDIFKGSLRFPEEGERLPAHSRSNKELRDFLAYLRELNEKESFISKIDIDRFEGDIAEGLYFESSIPQGFGIGSSGALCAAVYNTYAVDRIDIEEGLQKGHINRLKSEFAMMESFFHGKSSGIDPLICYLNLPLLIREGEVEPVKIAMKKDGQGAIFLIDTGKARKTEPLVNYYLEKMEEGTFREFVEKQLKPFTNNCIQAFLTGDHETLFGYLSKLSEFQFEHFKPMIPRLFKRMWKKGIDSGEYSLKLCGAGGGGFILGFTKNFEATQKALKGHNLEVVCRI